MNPGKRPTEAAPGLDAPVAMVELAAYEAGGRIVDHAVQIFGWRGCMREHSRSSASIARCAGSAS